MLLPDTSKTFQQCAEARPAITILGRIIGTPEKRLKVRCKKYTHWPATRSGSALYKKHVNPIYIWPFFPVDFDAHEVPIQNFSDLRIFEGLVLHDMAPV